MEDYATRVNAEFFSRAIDDSVMKRAYPDGETFSLTRVGTPPGHAPSGWYFLERSNTGTVWAWYGSFGKCKERFEEASETLNEWSVSRDV